MQYEVIISVRTTGTNSDEMHSLRECWNFGDNPKWFLAGQAFAVEQTAISMIERIRDRMNGSSSQEPMTEDMQRPRRV